MHSTSQLATCPREQVADRVLRGGMADCRVVLWTSPSNERRIRRGFDARREFDSRKPHALARLASREAASMAQLVSTRQE